MSASTDSVRRQEADAGQSAGTAATSAAAAVSAKTTAWVPKVKQQQSGDRRSSTSSSTGHVHDLGSDPILASGSETGTGKGKNRSKNKKMNWKPLPVPIIRRDPERDRDIRGMPARKYGSGSSTTGPAPAAGTLSGGRQQKQSALANGFRQNSAPAAAASSSPANTSASPHVQQQLSHPGAVTTGSSHNSADPHHGHPPLPSQHSHHHHNNSSNNNNHNNNNHNHQHQSAQSNSSDESKLQRSSSVSSSSSSSRPNNHQQHHQHHNNHPSHHPHHQMQKKQQQQQPDPNAQQNSDQTSNASSNASGESSGSKFSNNNNSSNNHNFNSNQQRLMNGSNRLPAARAPVLRSAGPSPPPASPAIATQSHQHQQHQQQNNRRQQTPDHQQHHHQSQHQPYYGRRSGPRVTSGSANGGSGRATPNSLKDSFSPEVQFFPVEYVTHNQHDLSAGVAAAQLQLSNKTSGLMSPVLTLPPGAVVVPGTAFAGPAATPPFYPPYATAIPVVTAGSAGHAVAAGPAAAVTVPSGLIPVSAFTMPSLPSDPLHGHPHHNHQVPLMDMIRAQIEYYFSEKNLVRDFFIRSKMDSEGFLPISLIASFRRIQDLTPDITVIIRSLENSATVELSQDHLKARPRINPHQWPMTTTDAGLSPPPLLSPMSPLSATSHHSPSASTRVSNGRADSGAHDQHVSGTSVSHAPVKSLNQVQAATDQRTGSPAAGADDSVARHLHQLQLSDAGDGGRSGMISDSTGASNPDQKLQQQSSSPGLDNSKAAGRGSNGSVSLQPSSSSSAASSSATNSEVTPAATTSPPASDASVSLHPDVPSFVPGQLYAAVVSSSSNGRV